MAKASTALMACAAAIVTALAGPALAQVMAQATPAQQEAVRGNCRSDFLSLCRGVTPGGAEALGCLKQNAAKLQPACKQAVDAINLPGSRSALPEPSTVGAAPSPEPTAATPPVSEPRMVVAQLGPRQLRNLQMACAGDAQIFCVGVPRDPKARIACLRDNAANLSPPCQQELRSLAAAMPGGAPGAAPAAVAGGQPTAEQQAAIRASCRSDAMSLCRGQQGQEAFTCLQSNSARLSAACKTAIGAVGGVVAAPAAAAARSAVPAGAVAQAQPTAEQQSAIRSNCRSDAMSLCPGQQGQQAFTCLKTNSAKVSAACRTAISAVGGAPAAAAPAAAPRPVAAPAAAAPAPAPATAAAPTQAQQDAIRANCRSDAISLCPGQQGQGAFACLQGNTAKLSPACRTAISAVGAPATPAAARPAAAPAASPPAAAAPATPAPATAAAPPAPATAAAPSQSEAESMAQLGRNCGGDIQTHCKGVSLGGGRLMACLAVNGAKLSPQCKQALTEVSQSR